jgi:hypothetical protein
MNNTKGCVRFKKFVLDNGSVVWVTINRNSVLISNERKESISFCPSMKKAGVSDLDFSSTMLRVNGEVIDENGKQLN